MSDFEVVLSRTTEEWQRDMRLTYNNAIDDFVKEMKKYWNGMSVMQEIIDVAENLKGDVEK